MIVTSEMRTTVVVAGIAAMILAGCSSNGSSDANVAEVEDSALADYVASEEATVPGLLEDFDGLYTDINIAAVPPSTVEYVYYYAEPIDPDAAVEYFDGAIGEIQDLCDTQVFPGMEAAGIVDPAVTYIYFDSEGTELWEHTFTSS
ncbi:hypothetical protein [Demequina sediminicola]|uniref:hypothetical protein n=1 Tax=Demequina sediminicola TaxID=1095026 RepID=UPI0007816988|nr:hypothetical protein [Demequina sediminicola]